MLTIEHIGNRMPRSFYHLLRPHMFVFKLPVGSYHTISPEMQKVDPHNNLMMRQSACCLYCSDGVDTKLQGIKQPGSSDIWEIRARWRWLSYPDLWIGRALSFPWKCLRSVNFYNGYEQKRLKSNIQRSCYNWTSQASPSLPSSPAALSRQDLSPED